VTARLSRAVLGLALLASSTARAAPSDPVLIDASRGVDRVNNGALEKRPDGTLVWPRRYFGITAPMDWSGYDFLEVILENPGSKPVAFSFEVKDAASNDYWTRVNQPEVVAPGLQTIRLPTRLRVGEPGRPGRPLDAAKVVSLILARDGRDDDAPVLVRGIVLKKAAKTAEPGVLAFHVGPEDAGVPDGFESLNENTTYDPARKWGWLERKFWAPYPQVNRVPAPDRLTASNLAIASAKLRIDLKPGKYRVWMIVDHPGGFWGEYPYYHRRTVRAQGALALDERMTPETARAAYFRWQDAEDREGDELFDRYWSQILKEKTFDVRVENGRLDLEFENEGCPDELPCFGVALSALAVYPIDTAAERARGHGWIERLRASRRAEFGAAHQLNGRPLTALLASWPAGLRAWDVAPGLDLSLARPADARPLPATAAPRVEAFRNARAIFAPVVSWKGASPRPVEWRVDGVPPGVAVEGGWIKFRALRSGLAGNLYSVRERWITDEKRRTFDREDLGRLWLRFSVPRDARPGVSSATLVLSGDGRMVRIPFELRVLEARAADLDFPVGPFGDGIIENWWDAATLRPRLTRLEEKSLLKMRALGLTAFSFSPRLKLSGDGTLDASETDRIMAAAKRLGFLGLVGYGDVLAGENLCARARPDSPSLERVTSLLEARSQERGWLPLALIACDEPVGAAVAEAAERLKSLPPPDAGRRVQWSVTTSLGEDADENTRALAGRVDLPFLTKYSQENVRKPWAYYNGASRESLGLGLFRLRKTTDLRDRLLWTWNANSGNPYFDFDGRESDYAWCASRADESLRCSVEFDRVVDRGLTDERVALGLRRLLDANKDLDAARRAEGERLLDEAALPGTDPDAWLAKAGAYEETVIKSLPSPAP
jgi:hypothetical protein